MITFKSSFINNVTIPKLVPNNKNLGQNCALVEFNTNSGSDYNLLDEISKNWNGGRSYATDVFDYFSTQGICRGISFFPSHRYFGLIDETEGKIDSKSVLAVINVLEEKKDNSCTLAYLQVNPKHVYGAETRKYKHIGQTIVESMLNIISAKTFKAIPGNEKSKKFLEKLNFKQTIESVYMTLKR